MKLRLINDPALREVCSPVEPDELEYVKSLIPEMITIMNEEEGIGLAANQVGIIKRFFIMKSGESVELIINPEIIEIGPLRPFEEGCLSIPGTSAKTQRAQQVTLKYRDDTFTEREKNLIGPEAVAIQHEIDHLNGKLYTDSLPGMTRIFVLDKHRKYIKLIGRKK